MVKKILKTIIGLSTCCGALSFLPITSCKKETKIITGPAIDESAKSQQFVDNKVTYSFVWQGWRPKNNEFQEVKLKLASEPKELQVAITNKPTIAPDKTFTIEVSITNQTEPVYSDLVWFNLEFVCDVQSKIQHYYVKDLLASYIPKTVIIEPEKKKYEMVSDINSETAYTYTDSFILTDTQLKPTDLTILITQGATGEYLGNIFADIQAVGQEFRLYITTEVFNAYADNYPISISILHGETELYKSSSFFLVFKPLMVEKEKTMRCFPVDDKENTWQTNEEFYLLHAPANEKAELYSVDLNVPEGIIVNTQLFYKSGDFRTDYSLHVEFTVTEPVTTFKNWDIGITLRYDQEGETLPILNDSHYNFFTAPAINTEEMSVNYVEVGEGDDKHTQVTASNLKWVDKFDSTFDDFDIPEIANLRGSWPAETPRFEPVISPIEEETGKFSVILDIYCDDNKPLGHGDYFITFRFKMKNPVNAEASPDEVECYFHVNEPTPP